MKKKYKFVLKKKKIWVAGHNGMVGRAIVKRFKQEDCLIMTVNRNDLNLLEQEKTFNWIKQNSPQVVVLAAAKVGGILANNTNQTDFLYQNLMIQNNIIKASADNQVEKLIFLGSSCIYPREASQPIKEEELLKKPLEQTNEGYALAKIAGLKLCSYYFKEHNKDFITVMPTNLYGENDNYDLKTSHVLAALIKKIVEAKFKNKEFVEIWGTGKPKREFLHVQDLAEAVHFLTINYSDYKPINVGTSKDISITELAEMIAYIVDWKGQFVFNKKIPDGTMLKRLDISKIKKLGWSPRIKINEGLKKTISSYIKNTFN